MSGITTFLFRKLPNSFNRAIRPRGACEINVEKAEMQHENFRRIVTSRMKRDNYVVLSPAESFPDSVFIEDSCVSLCEGIAVATTPSAPTRQGVSVRHADLQSAAHEIEMHLVNVHVRHFT